MQILSNKVSFSHGTAQTVLTFQLSANKHPLTPPKRAIVLSKKALGYCQNQLQHITLQSSMVMAVADIGSTIIWTTASKSMQRAAEAVNFIEGGCWGKAKLAQMRSLYR